MHTRIDGTPYRTGNEAMANREAQAITEHSTYCAIVKGIELPQDQDTEQYALLADGDTVYKPTEPHLSKRTK